MANLYRSYMRLCENWRLDPSKKGRDLGEIIRREIFKEFSQGEASKIRDPKDCERKFNSLNKLASNYYGRKYKRETYTTASGLTREQCRDVLSTENLKDLQKQTFGFKDYLKLKFRI